MTANKMEKRIEKLEETIYPKPKLKPVVIVQKVGETEDEAFARAGFNSKKRDGYMFWVVQLVAPPARDPISGEILNSMSEAR
jgi:hypothetical protein